MRHRLAQLKDARQGHVLRYSQRQSRAILSAFDLSEIEESDGSPWTESQGDDSLAADFLSDFAGPTLAPMKNHTPNSTPPLQTDDLPCFSDEETPTSGTTQSFSTVGATPFTFEVFDEDSSKILTQDDIKMEPYHEDSRLGVPYPKGLKRTYSQLSRKRPTSSNGSSASIHSTASSVLSRARGYIASVLSITNSWRSSLVYAQSTASESVSTLNETSPFQDDHEIKEEYGDDPNASIPPRHLPDYGEKSLLDRPCCGLRVIHIKDESGDTIPCLTCGFSNVHHNARTSRTNFPIGEVTDASLVDKFGNTPMHHAAAAGNLEWLLDYFRLADDANARHLLNIRNTSGESCFHVMEIKASDHRYLPRLLHQALRLGFSFTIRDHQGVTAITKLNAGLQRLNETTHWENLQEWERQTLRKAVADISSTWRNECPFTWHGNEPNTVDPNEIDINGNTKLIAMLKSISSGTLTRPRDFEMLLGKCDIHMRDWRGYTALAIAMRCGVIEAVSLLLKQGANANTRSYHQTSVVAHGLACLAKAQKERKDALYARILSCMLLVTDYGGKAEATVFDEYALTAYAEVAKVGRRARTGWVVVNQNVWQSGI